jgi:hypothetical protein
VTTAYSLHEIAAVLRGVADQLDAAGGIAIPETSVSISLQVLAHEGTAPAADRAAAVNAIAAVFGTTPETDPVTPSDKGRPHHRSRLYDPVDPVLAFTALDREPDPAGEPAVTGYQVGDRVRSVREPDETGFINRVDGDDLFVTWDGRWADSQENADTVTPDPF